MLARTERPARWLLPVLDISASALALFLGLPLAGGLPSISSSAAPWADGLWFLMILGGAFLLLAGGLKLLLRQAPLNFFVLLYTALISALGTLALQGRGSHFSVGGWLFMSLTIAGLLLSLHRPWLWATAGALWCVLLFGLLSVVDVIDFFSIETRQLSLFLPVQLVAFVLVVALVVVHFRYRNTVADKTSPEI